MVSMQRSWSLDSIQASVPPPSLGPWNLAPQLLKPELMDLSPLFPQFQSSVPDTQTVLSSPLACPSVPNQGSQPHFIPCTPP